MYILRGLRHRLHGSERHRRGAGDPALPDGVRLGEPGAGVSEIHPYLHRLHALPRRPLRGAPTGTAPDAHASPIPKPISDHAFEAAACIGCGACVAACPSACIAKDPETNLTIFDNTNCIGCHSCAMACPFGIPSFNEEGKMQKCDGCAVRIQNGLEPACVRACPVGALRLVSSEEIEGKDKENSLQKLGREVLEFQT